MSNLAALVQQFGDRTHYPTRDTVQSDRVKRAVRDILTSEIITRMPGRGLPVTWQFRMEPPTDLSAYTWEFVELNVLGGVGAQVAIRTDGTMSGRWLRFKIGSNYFLRRIRMVAAVAYKGPDAAIIVLEEPWENITDVPTEVKVFTLDYTVPHDITGIVSVTWSPDGLPQRRIPSRWPADLEDTTLFRRDTTGQPQLVGRGNRYFLEAPHDTPTAVATAQDVAHRWGYDSSGVERDSSYVGQRYGVAGTFTYKYCLVWGRRRFLHPTKGWGFLGPFIISPPSAASAAVTTTWGTSCVTLTTANMSWVYGFDPTSNSLARNRSGLEKWIFRARTAVESPTAGGNHADQKYIETDGVYYLHSIVDANTTEVSDRGEYDPVDRQFPLMPWQGQQSLRFDILPSASDFIQCRGIRRITDIYADADVPDLDPEVDPLLINRLTRRLIADVDGDDRKQMMLDAEFKTLMGVYLRNAASDKFQSGFGNAMQAPFGDGPYPGITFGPITLVEL